MVPYFMVVLSVVLACERCKAWNAISLFMLLYSAQVSVGCISMSWN